MKRYFEKALSLARANKGKLAILGWGTAFVFFGRVIFQGYRDLTKRSLAIAPAPLLVSLSILSVAFLTGGTVWYMVLRACGVRTGIRETVLDWLVAQGAKYLPIGTVWYLGGRFLLGRRAGIDGVVISIALGVEFALYMMEALVLLIAVFLLRQKQHLAAGLFIGMPNLLWLLFMPSSVAFLKSRLAGRLDSSSHLRGVLEDLEVQILRWLPPMYLLQWLLIGQAFWFLVTSVCLVPFSSFPSLAGAYSGASAFGYLAFFVPNGWGIRENVLSVLVEALSGCALGSVVAIIARLWYTIVELMCASIGLVLRRKLLRDQEMQL